MKRLRFLLIIPVFLCFTLIYLIGNSFLRRDEPLIHNYIPDEVDVLVEFDIKHFGSAFMYNMLYNSSYFNEKIPLPEGRESKDFPSMGVSPTNNFVFALERWGEGDFYYFIFQLNSQDDFKKFMDELGLKNKNMIHVSNHEVGIFGFATNVDKKMAQEYLDEVINKNVESIRTKYDLEEKFNLDRDLNIHVNTQAFIEGSKLEQIFGSIDLVSSTAILDVEYISNDVYEVEPLKGKILKSKNLHMSSTMKFKDILSTFGMRNISSVESFPEIKKWSVNNLGSQIEMQTGVEKDSVNELFKLESPGQQLLIDSKDKFGIFLANYGMKIALNTEEKFEILLEPENKEEFELYLRKLADSNVVQIDSVYKLITMGQFGKHKYKWVDSYFIIYPKNQDDVELVEIEEKGSYYYMNFDINPFFENIKMSGDGTTFSNIGTGIFNEQMAQVQLIMNNFDKAEVSLFYEGDKIKIHSTLSFKNKDGVAIIEMMSAFLNSNFKDFFF
jgi:hypothetical protein